jgi:hypothetical protein
MAVSTEYIRTESVEEDEAVSDGSNNDDGIHGYSEDEVDDGGGGGRKLKRGRVHIRGRAIRLDYSTVNKAAYRILALDHARIVLGVGPRTVKILYLV